jgi:hypothetical protein
MWKAAEPNDLGLNPDTQGSVAHGLSHSHAKFSLLISEIRGMDCEEAFSIHNEEWYNIKAGKSKLDSG